ncbi:helix-turn-helix domain-containing protein [Nocardia sp. NPDC051750]|uniref:helix-turn-helix domain-containing protein n=1 Tax=Nocardia sp. NPDC051750 TaxID=3364325 RepID=UPI0037BDF4F6
MFSRSAILQEAMVDTGTSQSELSRVSGVRQSSISQFLSDRTNLSDEQLDRLLSCMGYRLEVVRRSVAAELTRSEERSWLLHRRLSRHLTRSSLESWRPQVERNLRRLREGVTGQPHLRNLDRWSSLIARSDLPHLHRALTGLDRESIEMREVSPFGGILAQDERAAVLRKAG